MADTCLITAAVEARLKAYAPYSRFLVGAAVKDEHGSVHAGCNVENAAYPEGTCAEAGAIAAMVMAGGRRITEAAVVGAGDALVTPCGGCRQKLREFGTADLVVHVCDDKGAIRRSFTLEELLPQSFGPENLIGMIRALDIMRERLGTLRPEIAIVLGSSLGPVADAVVAPVRIPYRDLPGFPVPRISGHSGEVFAGHLGGKPVLILRGRGHPYEKGDAAVMRPVIEALQGFGITRLVLTNAAGSLKRDMRPGSIMLITDHINFSGMNPLIAEEGDKGFVTMTGAYDLNLAEAFRRAAQAEKVKLHEGVYVWFSGPSFETPAEIRMAQSWGADAVGMSTVPEVILARRFGLQVAGLSVITNLGAGIEGASPSHDETKSEGVRAVGDMVKLLSRFCAGTA